MNLMSCTDLAKATEVAVQVANNGVKKEYNKTHKTKQSIYYLGHDKKKNKRSILCNYCIQVYNSVYVVSYAIIYLQSI